MVDGLGGVGIVMMLGLGIAALLLYGAIDGIITRDGDGL